VRETLHAKASGMDISLDGRTLVICHDIDKIDTVDLIPEALALVPSADIRIVETPVSEIIKRIYKGTYTQADGRVRDSSPAH